MICFVSNVKIIQYMFNDNYISIENQIQVNWSLAYAVKLGLPYVVNILLSNRVDPNFIDQYGISLIEYTTDEKFVKTLNYLVDNG